MTYKDQYAKDKKEGQKITGSCVMEWNYRNKYRGLLVITDTTCLI